MESAFRRHADELTRFATMLVGSGDAADVVSEAFVSVFGAGDVSRLENPRAVLFRRCSVVLSITFARPAAVDLGSRCTSDAKPHLGRWMTARPSARGPCCRC